MACARFVAKEVGLAGKTNLEQAQVDEIVDVVQDLINSYSSSPSCWPWPLSRPR